MKKNKLIFWICTGLFAAVMGFGSVYDLLSHPEAIKHVTGLGYPAYLVPFLGFAKLLGILAILIPGYPRIKEWAYAGLAYDLIGAVYSHIAFGEGPSVWAPMVVFIVLLFGSYVYYHKLRKDAKNQTQPEMSLAGA